MRTISELLQSGNLAAARRHPQYMSSVCRGERFISQAVTDRRRQEQLCQSSSIKSVMPSIGGAAVDDWQMQQMDALLGEKKRFEGIYA